MDQEHKLLIVEDHGESRELLAALMRGCGWSPLEAGSVAEALELLDGTLELLVLDLTLPDGSGAELLRQVRERGLACQVIVTTGWPTTDERLDEVRRLHADALFQKPLDVSAFLELCQGSLAQRLS